MSFFADEEARAQERRDAAHDDDPPRVRPVMLGRPSSAMQALAYQVLTGPEDDAREAARVLAELVLEAGR